MGQHGLYEMGPPSVAPRRETRPRLDPFSPLDAHSRFDRSSVLKLQRLAGNAAVSGLLEGASPPELRTSVNAALTRGAASGLPASVRTAVEGRVGQDLSGVRVHRDAESTLALGAKAYTAGDDIVVHPDHAGDPVLAHEAVHVVQQRRGPVEGHDVGGGLAVSDPGDRHEQEADRVSHGAQRGGGEPMATRSPPSATPTLQRALLDGAASLEAAQTAVSGIAPTKRSGFGKFKDKIGKLFGRAPKRQLRTAEHVSWTSGKLADSIERAKLLRIQLGNNEVGAPGSRRAEGEEAASVLHQIALDLGSFEEQLGSVPEVDAAMRAIEADQAAITALMDGATAGVTPDMSWMDAIQATSAMGGVRGEMTRVAGLQTQHDKEFAGNQAESDKKTTAMFWRSADESSDKAKQYVIGALASGIVPRATSAAIESLSSVPDYAEATTHGASTPDQRVLAGARTAMKDVAPLFFPVDAGWVPASIVQFAAGVMSETEQKFGRGSPFAETAVLRLVVWLGAQTGFQNATLKGTPSGTVGNKAGLEMHRAMMETIFGKHNNSDEETYEESAAWFEFFKTSLMTRVRNAQRTGALAGSGV